MSDTTTKEKSQKSKGYNYFDKFIKMVDYSCKSAEILNINVHSFNCETLEQKMLELHELEHTADDEKHEMMSRLVKEFLPPIEREDIIELAQQIDNVTDCIEDVFMKMFMYNITEMRPLALQFTEVIITCCAALKKGMEDFHNFKKSQTFHESIIQINQLEETGDKLYTEAIRELYTTCKDPITIMAWTEVFERLEKCCDACEDVADVMESVVMKNS